MSVKQKYIKLKQQRDYLLVLFYYWFHGSSFKDFSIVFLVPDWLKSNHLKTQVEFGFSDISSCHICSTVAKTIGVKNYAASFGAKKYSGNHIWCCWDDARSVEPTIWTRTWLCPCFMSTPWKRWHKNLQQNFQIPLFWTILQKLSPLV